MTMSRSRHKKGDFVAVPIPMSNPTLGTGLMGGAAYFYPQTEEQKASQSASYNRCGRYVYQQR